MRLLAIDIGNTDTVAGLFDESSLLAKSRLASNRETTVDDAYAFVTAALRNSSLPPDKVERTIIASVVPLLTPIYNETCQRIVDVPPVVVNARIKLPVRIDIDRPDEVGADRIANAAASFKQYGGPVIVVDFGTATTFDVVNRDGAYIGGVIIPGPKTAMADLARKAAQLFEIKIEPPERVVGRSTEGALKSGMFLGTVGQVDYIIERILEETGFENCTIIATGGLAGSIERFSKHITQVEPDLTLHGLRLIAEMN